MFLSVDPSERKEKMQQMIDQLKSDNPSPDMYSSDDDHDAMIQRYQKQQKQHMSPMTYQERIKKHIQSIKDSIPPVNEDDKDEIGLQNEPTKKQHQDPRTAKELHDSRLAKMKSAIKGIQGVGLHSDKSDDSHDIQQDNILRLTLTKPLGFTLDADQVNEAIVSSLDDEYPSAVQRLSPSIQQELVGRRIVSVNNQDVTHLNLVEIAEQIVASANPVTLEFQVQEDDIDDKDEVLRLVMNKPLGLILDNDTTGEAIVVDLDDELLGTAHTLPTKIQEQLVGSKIIKVNDVDVTMLNASEVVERITASNNPVVLEFEKVNAEEEDDDPLKEIFDDNDDNNEDDKEEDDKEDEDDEEEEEEENEEEGDSPKKIEYYANHISECVARGKLSVMKWDDNRDVIDPYAAQIGLPERLVPTIRAYAKRLNIIEGLKDILYNHPCEPNSGRFYETKNPHVQQNHGQFSFYSSAKRKNEDLLWYAQRPGSHWNSDMHWFAGANERTHESMLRMLFEGGFEEVLDAIGTHYDLDGLFIQSVGFLGVTHCEEGFLHHDFKNVDGKFFNFLIPVYSPEGAGPELNVAGERNVKGHITEAYPIVGTIVKYDPEYGVLVGDGTLHGTRECDHRPEEEIRVVVSVYLADLSDDNEDNVASDDTAIFPVPEVVEWLWTQQGRHWRKDMCMLPDVGRQPFKTEDQSDRCVEVANQGLCESKPKLARKHCPKSCNVYMDDEEYRPGVKRSVIMGDFDFVV